MYKDKIKSLIRTIPDFPKPGIQFRDITTLLKDAEGLRLTIDAFAGRCHGKAIDVVAGIESRGFILGAPLALKLGVGFVPIRKPGDIAPLRFANLKAISLGVQVRLSIGSGSNTLITFR